MVTLCCGFAIEQAPSFDGLSFDPFSFQQDGLTASEVDIGRREIAQAFVIALMVIVRDEGLDLVLQIARQIIVLQKDAVLQGLVPALDLALCHGMVGHAANMLDVALAEPHRQIARDVAGAIVRQQPEPVRNGNLCQY